MVSPSRNDPTRLAKLRELLILDSAPERAYDDIVNLLATSLDVPIAMINMLDNDRDWFKSFKGLPVNESPAVNSFCEAFFNTDADLILVEDAKFDPRFATHTYVLDNPHIRFYASIRLNFDGHTVGTLCAYDVRPRQISAAQLEQMRLLTNGVLELLRERTKAT
jgi:GAF domain-containing protein